MELQLTNIVTDDQSPESHIIFIDYFYSKLTFSDVDKIFNLTNSFCEKYRIRQKHVHLQQYSDFFQAVIEHVNTRSYPISFFIDFIHDYLEIHFSLDHHVCTRLFPQFLCTTLLQPSIFDMFMNNKNFSILAKNYSLSKFFYVYPMHRYLDDIFNAVYFKVAESRLYAFCCHLRLTHQDFFFAYHTGNSVFYSFYICLSSYTFTYLTNLILNFVDLTNLLFRIFTLAFPEHLFKTYLLFIMDMFIATAPCFERVVGFSNLRFLRTFVSYLIYTEPYLLVRVFHFYRKHNSHDFSGRIPEEFCLFRNRNFGRTMFIQHGGESNPGPVFSKFFDYITFNLREKFFSQLNKATKTLDSFKDIALFSIYLMRFFDDFSGFITSLFRGSLTSAFELIVKLSSLALTAYETHKYLMHELRIKYRVLETQAGDAETFILGMGLSNFLPKTLKNLFKDMPIFCNIKLLDDLTWVQDFLSFLLSLPRRVFELFDYGNSPVISKIISVLHACEDCLPFSELSNLHYNVSKLLGEHHSTPSLHCNSAFQSKAILLNNRYKIVKRRVLAAKRNLPSYCVNIFKSFEDLMRNIEYARTNTRVEPVCIVMSGPPGCGKSTLMTMMDASYREHSSVYNDIPTDINKKHFYDSYNGEQIYMVDDMGQRAVSQWSEIINQVSSVKYKLECARAELKDTKSFISTLMIISCNHIPTQQQIGVGDGIAEIEALYRRIHRVDCSKMRFNGVFSGSIGIQRYDSNLGAKNWKTLQTMEIPDIEAEKAILTFLNDYITIEMNSRLRFFELNTRNPVPLPPLPRPQALSEVIRAYVVEVMEDYLPINKLTDYIFEKYGELNEFFDKQFPNYTDTCEEHGITAVTGVVLGGAVLTAIGLGCYAIYDVYRGKDEVEEKVEQPKHYAAPRHKMTVHKLMNQGVKNLFNLPFPIVPTPPQLARLMKNMVVVEISYLREAKTYVTKCSALASGDKFIVPYHAVCDNDTGEYIITVYTNNSIFYDKMEVRLIEKSIESDLAIMQLPRTAPRYFKKIEITTQSSNKRLFFITPSGVIDMQNRVSQSSFSTSYYNGSYCNKVAEHDLTYDFEADGMCGSWIVNGEGMLLAMHVLAADVEEDGMRKTIGIAKCISASDIRTLVKCVKMPIGNVLPVLETFKPDFSGVTLDRKSQHFSGGKNTIVPSLVHGIFPVLRKPAEIDDSRVMKKLSEEAFELNPHCDIEALSFAGKALDEVVGIEGYQFKALTEFEIVKGNDILNRIDPSTSPGVGHPGEKSDYLDYENGCIRDNMKQSMKKFMDEIITDTFDFDTYYASTLKMELRDTVDDVPKAPRVFQAGPLLLTLFYRILFGDLMSYVYTTKFTNGIMIGINPLGKDWHTFASNICRRSKNNICAGDFKWWDKKMHASFQRKCNVFLKRTVDLNLLRSQINIILNSTYTVSEVELVVDMLLELIVSTPTILLNMVIITTHNLPSGMALTAFYNSLVHKMISLYVYAIRCNQLKIKRDISEFLLNVDDYVYGDDKLMVVTDAYKKIMDPLNYANIVQTLALDFTTADKKPWDDATSYLNISKVSFLKRGFLGHPSLGRWVAPLDEKSMTSTLNYVTDELRDEELVIVKLLNFQREAFLHYDKYEKYMSGVKKFLGENLDYLPVKFLSKSALIELYNDDLYGSLIQFN